MIYPQNKKYTQTNRSTVLGNLWSTFNIDLTSNLGALRVSPRLKVNTSSATQATLGTPVGIKTFDTKIFAVCGTKVFVSSGANSAFTPDASGGASLGTDCSAEYSDIELFDGELVVTTKDKPYSKVANGSGTGDWSARGTDLGDMPHMMTVLPKFNRLYVTGESVSKIHSYDTAWTEATSGDYFIDVDPAGKQYHITSIKASSRSIFIGTMNKLDVAGRGAILEWDGLSDTVSNTYELDANACLAILIKNERVFAIDSNGVFLEFTGYAFKEIGRLPYNSFMPYNPNDSNNGRFIHPNGLLLTENNTILAFVDNRNYKGLGTINENFPSGVWELDLATGSCTHKYSLSYNPISSSTVTDYGQNRINRVGAIASVDIPTNSTTNGTIMLGATYYTDASATQSALFIDDFNDTIQKYGYFVTTKIFSQNILEMWQKIVPRFNSFASPDDITVKYRTSDEEPTEATITWLNNTSFTTTTDVSAYVVGDEVEGIQGTGSGMTSHITEITEDTGTYTVKLDRNHKAISGTAKVRFQKWKKIEQSYSGSNQFVELHLDKPSMWVQLKVCMLATGNKELYDILLSNITQQPIK